MMPKSVSRVATKVSRTAWGATRALTPPPRDRLYTHLLEMFFSTRDFFSALASVHGLIMGSLPFKKKHVPESWKAVVAARLRGGGGQEAQTSKK